MLECPFETLRCSWPCPISHSDGPWIHEPTWNTPTMPLLPQPRWEIINDHLYWTFKWSELFRCDLTPWDPIVGGEMRKFHIIFHLQLKVSGQLIFWGSDGCIIRRNSEIVYSHHNMQTTRENAIEVIAGDLLEIAQWHLQGLWQWGGYISTQRQTLSELLSDILLPYLTSVQKRLTQPEGPPVKIYTRGDAPIRTVASIYSLILNGFVPSEVFLFGNHQWSVGTENLFRLLLPFSHVIQTEEVLTRIEELNEPKLTYMAQEYWFVMKMCVSLLYSTQECCIIDDDVLILDRLDDALQAFQQNDLVYQPDLDQSAGYLATWGSIHSGLMPLRTARFNAGLYWIRSSKDPRWLALKASQISPNPKEAPFWEQGFIATIYAHEKIFELSSQRYFYPVLDGLPGGVLGYDYTENPCKFASIHFGGFVNKPSDATILFLLPRILRSQKV